MITKARSLIAGAVEHITIASAKKNTMVRAINKLRKNELRPLTKPLIIDFALVLCTYQSINVR